tara:strand:+ start:6330 stop:6617 length:288 start_codon:yes stop_codon:yes gene_type:complete
MNQVKNLVAPVCNVIQSNKQMLSLGLVLFVVTLMLPLDQLLRSNMKANLVNNLKGQLGMLTSVGSALLFLCLYFNNDTLNLVLLLYACVLLKLLN